jgi:hypothetical protein
VLWVALAAVAVIAALLLLGRPRGAAVRVLALALILLALANPSFTREDREPLSSVAAVVIDKSPSQNFGDRARETVKAREALVDSLKKINGLEVPTAKPMAPDCSARCPPCCRTFRSIASPAPS